MDYELTLKLTVQTQLDREQIAKNLIGSMEFGTAGEVITDALDAPERIGIVSLHVEHKVAVDDR
jgi:hypothetical protein